jgi:NAD(P)-dependent dehydrogenase (short-subunit alcohol dehydrogenase family)
MVILISDLLMDVPEVESALRALRAAGHDVTVLHLMDPGERDLDLAGEAVFVDPETGLEVPATVADVRDAYRATVDAAIEEWRRRLARAGAVYETLSTDAPFGVPLRLAFSARQHVLK